MVQESMFTPQVRGAAFDEDLISWIEDRGGATDSDESKPRLVIKDGYPVNYTCREELEEWSGGTWTDTDSGLIEIQFDFEITLRSPSISTFDENVREFQWSILWEVVKELGISDCSFPEAIPHTRRLRRAAQVHGKEYFFMVGSERTEEGDEGESHALFSATSSHVFPC